MVGLLNSSHSSSIESLMLGPFQTLKENSLPLCMRCSLTFVKVNKVHPLHLIQGQWILFNLYTLTLSYSLTHIYVLSLCCCLVSCQNESLIVGNMFDCLTIPYRWRLIHQSIRQYSQPMEYYSLCTSFRRKLIKLQQMD
jgi:hypothetical protein